MKENQQSSLPVLYSFRRCPFAIRARWVLAACQIPLTLIEVSLKQKPAQLLACSPKGTVPVLVLKAQVLDESLLIMKWALHTDALMECYFPLSQQEAIDGWIQRNDQLFKPNLDRYKYANRYPQADPQTAYAHAQSFLSELTQALKTTPFLLGSEITLADVAIFPFVRQFAFVDYSLFERQQDPRLVRWLQGFIQAPLFQGIMTKCAPMEVGSAWPMSNVGQADRVPFVS